LLASPSTWLKELALIWGKTGLPSSLPQAARSVSMNNKISCEKLFIDWKFFVKNRNSKKNQPKRLAKAKFQIRIFV
jgi:hypothetical protein